MHVEESSLVCTAGIEHSQQPNDKKVVKCPKCGNTTKFVEVLEGCTVEHEFHCTNDKWSFERDEIVSDNHIMEKFECRKCGHDCTDQHELFIDQYVKV